MFNEDNTPPETRVSYKGHNGVVGQPSSSGLSVWFYPDDNKFGGFTVKWCKLREEVKAEKLEKWTVCVWGKDPKNMSVYQGFVSQEEAELWVKNSFYGSHWVVRMSITANM